MTTVVVGTAIARVQVRPGDSDRRVSVTLTLDDRREWTFNQPAWRPVSVGAGPGVGYLWFARSVISIHEGAGYPEMFEVDEDLELVFKVDDGWLLVCETSVRLVTDGVETDRVELGDTVQSAHWADGRLVVHGRQGGVTRLSPVSGRLVR